MRRPGNLNLGDRYGLDDCETASDVALTDACARTIVGVRRSMLRPFGTVRRRMDGPVPPGEKGIVVGTGMGSERISAERREE